MVKDFFVVGSHEGLEPRWIDRVQFQSRITGINVYFSGISLLGDTNPTAISAQEWASSERMMLNNYNAQNVRRGRYCTVDKPPLDYTMNMYMWSCSHNLAATPTTPHFCFTCNGILMIIKFG